MNTLFRNPWLWALDGAFLALLLFIGLRFIFMPEGIVTHFHANFAIILDGERVDLTDDKYMEDVQSCKPDYVPLQPEERTHMHNNDMNVAHVHTQGVTWGHFMSNIGFAFGTSYLIADNGTMYQNSGARTIKFILNGQEAQNPFNTLIKSEDRLLISFGADTVDQLLKVQYPVVASDAHEHNEHPDPGSCSGTLELGFWQKLKKAVWY